MSNVFDKSWEPALSVTVSLFVSVSVSVTVSLSLSVTVYLSVTVSVSVSVDPCYMLNKFCFHVYAQKSLFLGENGNAFFWTSPPSPSPVSGPIIELVPS